MQNQTQIFPWSWLSTCVFVFILTCLNYYMSGESLHEESTEDVFVSAVVRMDSERA